MSIWKLLLWECVNVSLVKSESDYSLQFNDLHSIITSYEWMQIACQVTKINFKWIKFHCHFIKSWKIFSIHWIQSLWCESKQMKPKQEMPLNSELSTLSIFFVANAQTFIIFSRVWRILRSLFECGKVLKISFFPTDTNIETKTVKN